MPCHFSEEQNSHSIPHPANRVTFSPLLSWDRVYTGIRESRRPMAAHGRGVMRGRSPSAMFPPAPVRERRPGQKAASGRVASHTRLQVSSTRQDCTPWTSLNHSMSRPETGRGNAEGWPSRISETVRPIVSAAAGNRQTSERTIGRTVTAILPAAAFVASP